MVGARAGWRRRLRPPFEPLVGRFAIDRLVVRAGQSGTRHDALPLLRRCRADPAARRQYVRAIDHLRAPLGVEKRDQRFADRKLRDCLFRVELRVGAHGFGGGLDRLLVPGRERAQRMLDTIAELAQHRLGNVERVLRDEVDADPLRAD